MGRSGQDLELVPQVGIIVDAPTDEPFVRGRFDAHCTGIISSPGIVWAWEHPS
jgi:hypothetical protein